MAFSTYFSLQSFSSPKVAYNVPTTQSVVALHFIADGCCLASSQKCYSAFLYRIQRITICQSPTKTAMRIAPNRYRSPESTSQHYATIAMVIHEAVQPYPKHILKLLPISTTKCAYHLLQTFTLHQCGSYLSYATLRWESLWKEKRRRLQYGHPPAEIVRTVQI